MSNAPLPPELVAAKLADWPIDEIAMRLLEALFDKKSDARLKNDLVELGHSMSPHELSEIYRFILAMTTEDGRAQIAAFAPMWSQLLNGTGAVYARETLFDGTILFRSAVQAETRPRLGVFHQSSEWHVHAQLPVPGAFGPLSH